MTTNLRQIPEPLSAKFKNTFAYKTVKDRLPVILTKIVDSSFRQRHEIGATHGEKGCEDLKTVTGCLSELRYRLQTDKPLTLLTGERKDVSQWNKRLKDYEEKNKFAASWFKSPWLLVECYMYRKIIESFENSQVLKTFDPFHIQKEQSFIGALPAIQILARHTVELKETNSANLNETLIKENFLNFMQICLWGNQCDLSISSGENVHKVACPLKQVEHLKSFILINDSQLVYDFLRNSKRKNRIDFVLDNAGLEFFGDLCFAEFLITSKFTDKIVFHVKAIPWFISDTTIQDFMWTLEMLNGNESKDLIDLGRLWFKRIEDGSFKVEVHDFWTLPYPYCDMQSVAPDLYANLKESDLIIFKGDLNYRKLVSDLNWPTTATFVEALQKFAPSPLVTLRTLKADVVVGLEQGVAEKLNALNEDWMISGNYAVIQFYKP